jgi:hypothetical protein
LILRLAAWTEVRATSSDDCALDLCAAFETGFPFLFIYTKMVLEVTPTKDPVDAGAIVAYAHFERLTNALPESFDLGICKAATSPERVETGFMQGFIRVYISQSGQEGLIQQERF